MSSLLPFGVCIEAVTPVGDSVSLAECCTLLMCGTLLLLREVSLNLAGTVLSWNDPYGSGG